MGEVGWEATHLKKKKKMFMANDASRPTPLDRFTLQVQVPVNCLCPIVFFVCFFTVHFSLHNSNMAVFTLTEHIQQLSCAD